MTPDDPRHGTNAGYIAERRAGLPSCAPCRKARRYYEKRRKYDSATGRTRLIDATGTRRRIQALIALGWTAPHVARQLGISPDAVYKLANRYDVVRRDVAARIAAVYEDMSMQVPPRETRQQKRDASYALTVARKHGWAPPLAWDDIDRDPRPQGIKRPHAGRLTSLDEIKVARIFDGEFGLDASRDEKREVVRRWVRAGRSLKQLEEQTGWNATRYRPRPTPQQEAS